MRRFILSILFSSSIFLSPLFSHAAWVQKDLGTIQGLTAMAQYGEAYVAVGNTGNIIRSSDKGTTWSVVDQNTSVYWQDIDSEGQSVSVVGEGGAMRSSSDGGAHWQNVSLGVTNTLYEVNVNAAYGFIVGDHGRIMTLSGYGNTWVSNVSPTSLALYGVSNRADGSAWIVGAEGALLYTADYGNNWTNKGKIAETDLYGVWFTSPTTGYVVGKNGTFRKTTDGGSSWMTLTVSGLVSQTLYDISGSGDNLIVVGDKIILRSSDKGATWTSTDYTAQNQTFKGSLIDSSGNVWAVGTQDDVKSVIWEDASVSAVELSPSPSTGSGDKSNSEDQHTVASNTLIKVACLASSLANDPCRAVYFYGSDGKRHAFPNEKVFFTWYDSFNNVTTVSSSFLSSLPLGKNVTYHPGMRLVKFQSVPTVYAVSKGGQLRAVATEEVASGLYGTDWNKKVDDISDAFFGNYVFGTKIEQTNSYDVVAAKTSVVSLDENF
ncbi:hypothetical protein HZA85_02785 [Candidatus Uhrbacteria bacterium]|nr:hypothetical protein [Candidatus Uhrbacteria bacterium]